MQASLHRGRYLGVFLACTSAMWACGIRTPLDNSNQPNDASADQLLPTSDVRVPQDLPPDRLVVPETQVDLPPPNDTKPATPDLQSDGLADRYPDVRLDALLDLLSDLPPELPRDLPPDLLRDSRTDNSPDFPSDRGPDLSPDVRPDLPSDVRLDVRPDLLPDLRPDLLSDLLVPPPDATCASGQTLPCTCDNGLSGSRICLPSHSFSECGCGSDALMRVKNGAIGTWTGTVTTPWVPPYKVTFTFDSYSHYSAKSLDSGQVALYYGTDADSSLKQYTISDVQASGDATGTIDIVFDGGSTNRDNLQAVQLSADLSHLRFYFMHDGSYGPLQYDLQRAAQ